jgi:NAD-dependent deacetylase
MARRADTVLLQSAALELAHRLGCARRAAALTGAGISAESGIPTFRSGATALWRDHRAEDLATPEAFARDPTLVTQWYRMRLETVLAATPNSGHAALVRLAQCVPDFTLITQNVDGLHAAAGSRDVVELHGSIHRWRCVSCERQSRLAADSSRPTQRCPCGGLLRPGVVWFGEVLPASAWDIAQRAATRAEVFLVIGTSAAVYPAAGLALLAKQSGAYVAEVNPETTQATPFCDLCVRAPSGEFLALVVDALISRAVPRSQPGRA